MRCFVLLLAAFKAAMLVSPACAQNERPRIFIEDLLEVDAEESREDEAARCRAIAGRFAQTAESVLSRRINELDAYCRLTAKQRRRLELAARGTARKTGEKFVARVGHAEAIDSPLLSRARLETIREEMIKAARAPETVEMWTKAVESTLDEQQRAELQRNLDARERFLKRRWVVNAVFEIERSARLTIEQREVVVESLTDWVRENAIPKRQTARRGPWKEIPAEVMTTLVFEKLDRERVERLLDLAPQSLRLELIPRANKEQP